jgi:trimethylamine:corrinoid methyltransferase-like protein
MMSEFFYPNLGVRHSFDIWEEKGRPSMLSHAREAVEEILADGEEGLLDPYLIAEINKTFPGIQNI